MINRVRKFITKLRCEFWLRRLWKQRKCPLHTNAAIWDFTIAGQCSHCLTAWRMARREQIIQRAMAGFHEALAKYDAS